MRPRPDARLLPLPESPPAATPLAPKARGTSRQRHPWRSTKTIPASADRSDTRGRPPLACLGQRGRSGSTASQSSSGTKSMVCMAIDYGNPAGF
jgi:hypothetical protein